MKNYLYKTFTYLSLLLFLGAVTAQPLYAIRDAGTKRKPYVGMAILALLHKNFPVKQAFTILKRSKRPAFSFAYGIFGKNPKNYYDLVSRFLEIGKTPHVEIYILSGPTRIPRRDGKMEFFHPELTIPELRRAIVNNAEIRRDYVTLVKKIAEEFIDPYPELTFTIVPELEDLESTESFKALLELTRSALGSRSNVELVRNNDHRFGNLPKEIHTTDKNRVRGLKRGDIISFDGSGFTFPEERHQPRVPTFTDIKKLIRMAKRKGVDVYIWRPENQGLSSSSTNVSPPPDQRRYVFKYKRRLIQLLRS